MIEEQPMSWETGDAVDTFECYMRDVRRFSLLGPEEEERLTRRLEEGRKATAALAEAGVRAGRRAALEELEERGREARDQLVAANLRLVVPIARRCSKRGLVHGLEVLDLIQEGNLALLRAAEAFKIGEVKFTTFATPFVRQRIERAVTNQGRLVRLPVHVREKLDRLELEERWYLGEKGRPPTPEELAAELGTSVDAVVELRGAEREVLSLDEPAPGGEEEEQLAYADLAEDPEAAAFVGRVEDRRFLDGLLAVVDPRSRRFLAWHYGLDLTFGAIAKHEGLSRERVRQIVRDALEKVRRAIRLAGLTSW